MKLVISSKLKKDLQVGKSKSAVLKTADLEAIDFINKMIRRINEYYQITLPTIESIDEIDDDKSLDKYICRILDDNQEIFADFVISSIAKWGNTIISQELMGTLLERIIDDPYYLDNKVKKFVYLTIPRKNSRSSTQKLILSSLQTLGFDIIDMEEENTPLPKPYIYIKDLMNDLTESKDKNSANKQSSLKLKEGNLILNIKNLIGQTSKYYALFILVVLKLSSIEFRYEGKCDPDKTIINLSKLFEKNNMQDSLSMDNVDIPKGSGKNLLLYGAPGTGKSFYLKKNYTQNVHRVTFYPDYDYSDFIGGIKPVLEKDRLTYKYVPGELLISVVDAYKKSNEEVNLIIEEINRANAASVFGDVFQLLDRQDDGISKYSINNKEICSYLDKIFNTNYFSEKGFKLPGNLNILATMNPSDQGVFVLDTAFKRRWDQQYFEIDWENIDSELVKTHKLNGFNKTWVELGRKLNRLMMKFDVEEDALFGPYFLTEKEIEENNVDRIASKILGNMWNDSLRYQRKEIFKYDTLASNIEGVKKEGMKIFKEY